MITERKVGAFKFSSFLASETNKEFFDDKILPVEFYDGNIETVVIVECNTKLDTMEIIEKDFMASEKKMDVELAKKKLLAYMNTMELVYTAVLMERLSCNIIYDFIVRSVIDWNVVSDLPPQNTNNFVVFYYEKDDSMSPIHLISYSGIETGLYIRSHSQSLFHTDKKSVIGLTLAADLFCEYYGLSIMNDVVKVWAFKPDRSVSRYEESQLKMLDGFRQRIRITQNGIQETGEAIAESVRSAQSGEDGGTGPVVDIGPITDEILFDKQYVTLSWIRDHGRVPRLKGRRIVVNDIGYYAGTIAQFYCEGNILYYKCEAGKYINPVLVFQFLGVEVLEDEPMVM